MFLSSTRKKARPSAECLSNPLLLVISYAFNCLNACTIRQARFCVREGRERVRKGNGNERRRRQGRKEERERGRKEERMKKIEKGKVRQKGSVIKEGWGEEGWER